MDSSRPSACAALAVELMMSSTVSRGTLTQGWRRTCSRDTPPTPPPPQPSGPADDEQQSPVVAHPAQDEKEYKYHSRTHHQPPGSHRAQQMPTMVVQKMYAVPGSP